MQRRLKPFLALGPMVALLVGALAGASRAQGGGAHGSMGGQPMPMPAQGGEPMHRTPPGWKMKWPKGDPAKGRPVFVKLECYSCHEVKGEHFPAPTNARSLGPELSMMGPMHPAEYFLEKIVNPSATIEPGKGYAAPDGSSKMPSYNDLMTVEELIELVAYLQSLRPPTMGKPSGHSMH